MHTYTFQLEMRMHVEEERQKQKLAVLDAQRQVSYAHSDILNEVD
jgi:hypothetical protein